jgi:hypothetical protein
MIFSNELEVVDRVVGNVEPIGAILQDIDGNVIDLTGESVLFRLIKTSDSSVKVDNSAATIDPDPTTGKVTYNPLATDVDTIGKYAMYFIIDGSPQRRFPYDGAVWVLNIKNEGK